MSETSQPKDVLSSLAAIVGAAHVVSDLDVIAGHLVEPRGLYRGKALALIRPASTQETARAVALCNDLRVPLVPQGGNTGLVGGQTPDSSGGEVILSLQRMNRVREIDASANAMIVEAGVTLANAQTAAQEADRLFPLSLASEGTCTIGGNLSTNAGGVAVIAYGNARDLVMGLEVVLADGRVMNGLSKLRKDNTGYDLKNLFIGAEGTLGIITAAALKLFPNPRSRATAFIGIANPVKALQLLNIARQFAGAGVTSFELIPRIGLDFVLAHANGSRDPLGSNHAWYALVEISSQMAAGIDETMSSILEAALEQGVIEDASIAASHAQREAFWLLRESLSEVQGLEGGSIKHDVSIPIGAAPDFLARAREAVEAFMPGARVVAFGHLGDGNIHFNVSQPLGADKAAFLAQWNAVNVIVHDIVAQFHGSISAEHGIGQLKRELLKKTKDPVALDVMRALKSTLDPKGILNPGKVL
ncbi:FAD-binding oxidoreductase [Methylocapsa sp. S129]|uniref:FAD-binding oxidoreductase n=1 Tax=Methylocapsa sp. S129 TaxID=1641869 RepID=UPI00131B9ADC|nr:FAD-binding oxidoreductase [Methylocapsa sp. S129]